MGNEYLQLRHVAWAVLTLLVQGGCLARTEQAPRPSGGDTGNAQSGDVDRTAAGDAGLVPGGDTNVGLDGDTGVIMSGDTTQPVLEFVTPERPLMLGGTLFLGEIEAPIFSPSGNLIAFRADITHDDRHELLIANSDGTGLRRIGLRPPPDANIHQHQFTPDGASLVYAMDTGLSTPVKLYSVSVIGNVTRELTASLAPELTVEPNPTLHLTSESTSVLFTARQGTPLGGKSLFKANIDGTAAMQLLPANVSLVYSLLSPDGSYAALVGTVDGGTPVAQRVNLDGSGWVVIDPATSLSWLLISPDSATIAYVVTAGGRPLRVADANGVTGLRTISNLVSRVHNSRGSATFTPDSTRVIYLADDSNFVDQVHSARVDGGGAITLNGTLPANGDVASYAVTSDNQVVYTADQDTDNIPELYAVAATGGVPTKLSGTLITGGIVAGSNFAVAPDSSHVVFLSDAETDGDWQLYSAPLDGSTRTKMSQSAISLGTYPKFSISGDSQRVLVKEPGGLRSTTLDGASSVLLSDDAAGGIVLNFGSSANSTRVWYDVLDGVKVLHAIDYDGTSAARISTPSTAGLLAGALHTSPSSSHVFHIPGIVPGLPSGAILATAVSTGITAQISQTAVKGFGSDRVQFSAANNRLFYKGSTGLTTVSLDGSNHVRLVGSGTVYHFVPTQSGQKVAYSNFDGVFAINSDGTGLTTLNGTMVSRGAVDFQAPVRISAPAGRVIYAADQSTDGIIELYSSLLDGTLNIKLNGTLQSGESIRTNSARNSWELTPDGTKVVYAAMQDSSTRQLYTTNPDGTNNTRLALDAVENVRPRHFILSPDSQRVVYTSGAGDLTEIYAAALDGTGSNKASAPLDVGQSIVFPWKLDAFVITGDSNHVLYRVDSNTGAARDLYAGALDGSGATRLNPPLAGRVVSQIAHLASSGRVIYLAEQDSAGTAEMFSVLSNGTGHRDLVADLPPQSAVEEFLVSEDESVIVYRADADTVGILELYSVRPNGTGRRKLHADLTTGFGVQEYKITADGRSVIYILEDGGPSMSVHLVTGVR